MARLKSHVPSWGRGRLVELRMEWREWRSGLKAAYLLLAQLCRCRRGLMGGEGEEPFFQIILNTRGRWGGSFALIVDCTKDATRTI